MLNLIAAFSLAGVMLLCQSWCERTLKSQLSSDEYKRLLGILDASKVGFYALYMPLIAVQLFKDGKIFLVLSAIRTFIFLVALLCYVGAILVSATMLLKHAFCGNICL